jgi:hypothetical protein
MTTRVLGAALLLMALALLVSSSAGATDHASAPEPAGQSYAAAAARAAAAAQPVALFAQPTGTPTTEEVCTRMLWEWIGPYWELGDQAAPAGLDYRYRRCLGPWYPYG